MSEFMTNAEGHLVPTDKVRPEDILENEMVLGLFVAAVNLEEKLCAFKGHAFSEVRTFVDILAEKYGANRGGKRGNLTLTSYDGLTRVQISVADYIQFGPQLQVAKGLIDQCIHDWSDGASANIRALVDHAFRVDKNNRVNAQAILGLRRLDIRDEKWTRAMQAITDSVRVVSSKQYVRFYRRPSPEANWKAVNLDIAGV
jgi:hypothetical protein